jgi:selenium-binding protein 1
VVQELRDAAGPSRPRISDDNTTEETSMRLKIRAIAVLAASVMALPTHADETCNSPYMAGLIKGQEDFVHVWTLGVKGMGDGNDKLVTIDANPKSKRYGQVIHKL